MQMHAFAAQYGKFHVTVAHTTDEACKLVETGFEYVTGDYNDGGRILRKRK